MNHFSSSIKTIARVCKSNRVVLNAYRNVYFSTYSRLFTSVPSFYYRSFADEAQANETNGDEAPGNETKETEVDKEKIELKNKINDLENDMKRMKDQNLRLLAEMENTRKIAKNDVSEARLYGVKSLVKSLLPVFDALDLAVCHLPKNVEGEYVQLVDGIKLISKDLEGILKSNQIIKYCDIGDVFDPKIHDALFNMPSEKIEANRVGQVVSCGYYLNNRVLRPAKVGVVQKKAE